MRKTKPGAREREVRTTIRDVWAGLRRLEQLKGERSQLAVQLAALALVPVHDEPSATTGAARYRAALTALDDRPRLPSLAARREALRAGHPESHRRPGDLTRADESIDLASGIAGLRLRRERQTKDTVESLHTVTRLLREAQEALYECRAQKTVGKLLRAYGALSSAAELVDVEGAVDDAIAAIEEAPCNSSDDALALAFVHVGAACGLRVHVERAKREIAACLEATGPGPRVAR